MFRRKGVKCKVTKNSPENLVSIPPFAYLRANRIKRTKSTVFYHKKQPLYHEEESYWGVGPDCTFGMGRIYYSGSGGRNFRSGRVREPFDGNGIYI